MGSIDYYGSRNAPANVAPTDIQISPLTVAQDAVDGYVIGTLTVTDPDDTAWLIAGWSNPKFFLIANVLAASFQLTRKVQGGALVQGVDEIVVIGIHDEHGNEFAKSFTIPVTAPSVAKNIATTFAGVGTMASHIQPQIRAAFSGNGTFADTTGDVQFSTMTFVNTGAGAAVAQPVTFGLLIQRADCPAGFYPVIKYNDGTIVARQQLDEEAVPYADGSHKHYVCTFAYDPNVAAIAAGASHTFKLYRRPGTYSAAANARSSTDVTALNIQTLLTDVRNHVNATVGSGNFTHSVNDGFTDNTVDITSSGVVKLSYVAHSAAIDTTPTTTTITNALDSSETGSKVVANAASFPSTTGIYPALGSTTFIAKINSETVLCQSVDGTHINIVMRGACRSTRATHLAGATITYIGHFWVRHYIDVFTLDNSTLYGISHIPLVMQPWCNVTGADQVTYRAVTKASGVDVRAVPWANTASVLQNSTNINTGGNTINMGSQLWAQGEAVDFTPVGAGILPSPLQVNTPYYLGAPAGSTYVIRPDITLGSQVDITNTGSAGDTMTVTRRITHPYRLGWWGANDDLGNRNWTVAKPTLYPKLSATEQAYWIGTGMVPPYDLSVAPAAAVSVTAGQSDTGLYRPTCCVVIISGPSQGGDPGNVGPLPIWDVQAFLNQTKNDIDITRAAALGKAHFPWICTLQEATGYIQPFNNGPDRIGGSYSKLGKPQPQWTLNTLGPTLMSGFVIPATGLNGNTVGTGRFSTSGGAGDNPSLGHIATSALMQYFYWGGREFLDTMYFDGNIYGLVQRTPTVYSFSTAKVKQFNGAGTTYYNNWAFGANARSPQAAKNAVIASVFGGSANQERQYHADCVRENLDFWAALQTKQGGNQAAQAVGGYFDPGVSGGIDGLVTWWGAWWFTWGRAIDDVNVTLGLYDDLINRIKNMYTCRWGESVTGSLSSYYGASEYATNFADSRVSPMASANWNGPFVTNFPDMTHHCIGPAMGSGGSFRVTAGSPYIDITGALNYTNNTVPFTAGQVLTGASSGTKATIFSDANTGTTGTLHLYNVGPTGFLPHFTNNETVTDGLGGTAKISVPGTSSGMNDVGFLQGANIQNGDKFKCTTPTISGGFGAYTGPSEISPAIQEWYYIQNVSNPDGYMIFTLSFDQAGTSPVGNFGTTKTSQPYGVRPSYSPAANTTIGVYNNSGWGVAAIGYGQVHYAMMNWIKSITGTATLDTAIANCGNRILVPLAGKQANPKYCMTLQLMK